MWSAEKKNTIGYEFDSPEVIQEVDIDLHYLSFDESGVPIGNETINWTMDSKGTVRMLHLACVMVDAYNKGKNYFLLMNSIQLFMYQFANF
ncbi:hypothetical protein OL548_10585 [Lysinibacillus sp. MHQ-1]|nr:hypothetical protein OL548_10585 [Lysinibacillus sp. MHQ-1]